MPPVLTSRDNPRVKRWARLIEDAKFRRKEARTIIEGPHLLLALLQAGLEPVAIIATEAGLKSPEIAALAGDSAVVVSEGVFGAIVEADNPPGIAAEIPIPARSQRGEHQVFLEGVQDPGNVGAIIRSAAAFGVGRVVLDPACADPWSPRTLRAGMGGHFAIRIDETRDLEDELGAFAGTLACTVPRGGLPLRKFSFEKPVGWIFGAEGRGISARVAEHAKAKVTIPMASGTESLNVAAAAAICFYEVFSRPGAGS